MVQRAELLERVKHAVHGLNPRQTSCCMAPVHVAMRMPSLIGIF